MVAGYDISKFPKKFQSAFFILGVVVFCFTVFNFVYVNAGPYLFPNFFAVDNEQRVYLSYHSGVYVVDGDRFYPIFSETSQSPTINITDQDMRYVANVGVYTAIDLNTSVPKEGNIQSKIVSSDDVRGLFDHNELTHHETDEQGGTYYRYDKSLFRYEIVRETNQGDQVLFRMPQREYALNLFVWIGAVIIALWGVIDLLISYCYTVKHPETLTKFRLYQ